MSISPPKEYMVSRESVPTEVLIKEARRRGRRQLAFVFMIVALIAGSLTWLESDRGGSPPPPADSAPFGTSPSASGWTEWNHAWGAMSSAPSRGNSVDCLSARFCMAVGASIATWNGVTWRDQALPAAPNRGENIQWGPVACASSTFCVAGGSYFGRWSSYAEAEVATWNGRKWRDYELAAKLNVFNADTDSVACVSPSFCVAAGNYTSQTNSPTYSGAFVATWNGRAWRDHALTGGPGNLGVTSVSCASATFCVAGDGGGAYVWTWNGTHWIGHNFASLNKYGNNGIDSVSCVSAVFCLAGDLTVTAKDGNYLAFVLIWNGRSWRTQELATALNTGQQGQINSVSCASANFCAVTGQYATQFGDPKSFAAIWNGKSWSYQDINVGSNAAVDGGINSVSCISASFCIGAGAHPFGNFDSEGLLSFWNGVRWSNYVIEPEPVGNQPRRKGGPSAIAGIQGDLDSISCPSVEFCAADDFYVESVGELGYTQGRSLLWTWSRS